MLRRAFLSYLKFYLIIVVVAGLVTIFSGPGINGFLLFVAWPITTFTHIMPKHSLVLKWLYASASVGVEALFVYAVLDLVFDVKRRFSRESMKLIARLLLQVQARVLDAWSLQPSDCRFYWLVKQKEAEKGYDYFTSDRHLREEDLQIIEQVGLAKKQVVEEKNLKWKFPRNDAYQCIFIRNAGGFRLGLFVFIDRPNVLNDVRVTALENIVDTIISLDDTGRVVIELAKRRKKGEIVI